MNKLILNFKSTSFINSNNIIKLCDNIKYFSTTTTEPTTTTTTTTKRKTPFEIKLKEEKEKLKHVKNVITLNVNPQDFESIKNTVNKDLMDKVKIYHKLDKPYHLDLSFPTRDDASKFFNQARKCLISINETNQIERQKLKQLNKEMEEKERLEREEKERKEMEENGDGVVETKKKGRKEFIKKKWAVPQHLPWISVKTSSIEPIYNVDKNQLLSLPKGTIDINTIKVIDNIDDVNDAIKLLLNGKLVDEVTEDDFITLGFDCEWDGLKKFLVGQHSKVSLISLSNGIDHVLFRTCNIGLSESDQLGKLLMNQSILKTGFGIGKDANRIKKDYGFLMDGVLDLTYTPKIQSAFNKSSIGVVKATAALYDVNIQRNRTLVLSNWSSSQGLTMEQVKSAALYSYYSYKTYFLLPTLNIDLFNYKDNSFFKV